MAPEWLSARSISSTRLTLSKNCASRISRRTSSTMWKFRGRGDRAFLSNDRGDHAIALAQNASAVPQARPRGPTEPPSARMRWPARPSACSSSVSALRSSARMGSGDSGRRCDERPGDATSRRSPETCQSRHVRGLSAGRRMGERRGADAESGGDGPSFRSRTRCLYDVRLPFVSCRDAMRGHNWIVPRSARWAPWLGPHALAARERLPIDLDEHERVMPRRTIHPAHRRGGSHARMDALPQAVRRGSMEPARRRLARAFLEALGREGVHNLLGHRDPAALRHHPCHPALLAKLVERAHRSRDRAHDPSS